jgi:hypothetical protein
VTCRTGRLPAIKARLLARPVAIFLASRAGVLLIASAIAFDEHLPVMTLLTRWDGPWYAIAATKGYPSVIPPGQGNMAQSALGFFPLYPMAIRATMTVSGLGPHGASLAVGFTGGLVGAVLVWLLINAVYGSSAADRGTALVFVSPGAYVLSMAYSETVLLPLVAGCLLALHHRRWLAAGVLAAGATACDPVGIAIVVPCVIAAVTAIRARRDWWSLITPALAPAGIGAFFAYLWAHDGTPFAWFIAQRRGWQPGRLGSGLWTQLLVIRGDHLSLPPYTVKAAGFVVAMALLAVFLTTRRPGTWTGYVVAVLALALMSPIVGFTPRTLLRAFPLVGVVGARASSGWFEALLIMFGLAMAAAAALSFGSLGLAP